MSADALRLKDERDRIVVLEHRVELLEGRASTADHRAGVIEERISMMDAALQRTHAVVMKIQEEAQAGRKEQQEVNGEIIQRLKDLSTP